MANMENDPKAKEILDQEISPDELDAVAGGDGERFKCVISEYREIYAGNGFPNCAATVEDGSWCGDNDACVFDAVKYDGMRDCGKAWR